jgi:transcriptional accessory protein Tex/SPT6
MTITIDSICSSFRSTLMAPPLEPVHVLVLYPTETETRMAVLSPSGELLFLTCLYPEHSERQKIESIESIRRTLHHFALRTIVIPASVEADTTAAFISSFKLPADVRTLRIADAGPIAKAMIPPQKTNAPDIAAAAAIAISLGRAAQDPFRELSTIDPLVLVDHTALGDSDRNALTKKLHEIIDACRQEIEDADNDPRGQTAAIRFTEGIQTIEDLAVDMHVSGVVTNVTPFGAFVNVGIPQEGLVHISEMSSDFVGDPAALVQPGQSVRVRVLSVDPEKKRLALSLRDKRKQPAKQSKRKKQVPPGNKRPRQGGRPSFNNQALGDAFDALGL